MNNLSIDVLTEKYVDLVYEIEKTLIGDCDKNTILNSLTSDVLKYFILLKNDQVIGFFECQIIPPEIELFDIAIIQSEQGNGYSKILMDYLINFARENNCETILLEVNNINSKAINLYNKFGFKKYSERKNYYGKNDAILMKLELKWQFCFCEVY